MRTPYKALVMTVASSLKSGTRVGWGRKYREEEEEERALVQLTAPGDWLCT